MYAYDRGSANEALAASKNAETNAKTIPADISSALSIASSVKVEGLDFLNNGEYADTVSTVLNYSTVINDMITTAEKNLIIECLQSGDQAKFVEYINSGKISTQALIEYSKEYMLDIMNSGNANTYNVGYAVIGGNNSGYSSVNDALLKKGFSSEFVYNLSNEFCRNLINNNLMYTKEGAVSMAMSFTGFLSMLGLKLGYSHVEFDRSYHGFYLGTGKEGSVTLGAIDCCNYTDWLSRCVGIDIYSYGPAEKHLYSKDGYTPDSEILAGSNSDYYRKGEGVITFPIKDI